MNVAYLTDDSKDFKELAQQCVEWSCKAQYMNERQMEVVQFRLALDLIRLQAEEGIGRNPSTPKGS